MVAGTPALIRNLDLSAELERMAQGLTVDWIAATSWAVVQVEQGMRRNLLRSLSLMRWLSACRNGSGGVHRYLDAKKCNPIYRASFGVESEHSKGKDQT